MLFAYKYVPHSMDKMQQFIDFIFLAVWCKARQRGDFGLHLFAANAQLYEVMKSFHYSETQTADFFSSHVEGIYHRFRDLSPYDIKKLRRWYRTNNDVEGICTKKPNRPPIRYTDIQATYPRLAQQLAHFFKGLYDKLGTAALKAKIGDIDAHYTAFTTVNSDNICPFCGISGMFGQYDNRREAYDHYLPKALYPFNSVNFRNLVPACHHCNSSYKGSKDPTLSPKDPARGAARRKMFYPYSTQAHHIDITVVLKRNSFDEPTPEDIALDFGPDALAEPIATWKDIYGIEACYKAKLCGDNDGKYWLAQVIDEWKEDGHQPDDFMRTLRRQTQRAPYAQCNFLKQPFLEGCQNAGLFNVKD